MRSRDPGDKTHMENGFISIDLNEKGQFISIYDKKAARELLPEGQAANVLMSYEDRPHNYDAWDLNNYYTENPGRLMMWQRFR